jgi:hypothetical protein
MPFFKRLPTVVDAEQFTDVDNPPRGVQSSLYVGHYVETIQHRTVSVDVGEWIIQEADGQHYYPIADDEFKRLYAPVEEGELV